MTDPIRIEIVSDMVCPWCWVGKRRLERAIDERPDLTVERVWRSYMLNPDMPPRGIPRRDYMAAKFGTQNLGRLHQPLVDIGEQEGIPFDFRAIQVMPSSLNAHRLVRWARTAGVQAAVVEDLFTRYFARGEDIGDSAVLTEAAGTAGMDTTIVAGLLASDDDIDLIRREDALARQIGVQGVPAFIINGKWAVVGAEPTEHWRDLLARVAAGEDLAGSS